MAAQKSAAAGGWLLSKLPKIQLFEAGTLRVPSAWKWLTITNPGYGTRSVPTTLLPVVARKAYRIVRTGNVKGQRRRFRRTDGSQSRVLFWFRCGDGSDSWSAAGAEGVFEAHLPRDFFLPRFAAKGLAFQYAAANGLQFRFRLSFVHMVEPRSPQRHWGIG
jgi:hypothetical protein